MSHTKTTWSSSTTFTTTNLNNLENQYAHWLADHYTGHSHSSRYYTKTTMDSTYWHAGNDGSGSGCDADLILEDDNSTTHHGSEITGSGAPVGIIVMYYGEDPGSSWKICNGDNGTPDLRNKFLVGAGSTYAYGDTGGANFVTPEKSSATVGSTALTAENIYHEHTYDDNYATSHPSASKVGSGASTSSGNTYESKTSTTYSGSSSGHTHTGTYTGYQVDMRPPFYALHYIQRVAV